MTPSQSRQPDGRPWDKEVDLLIVGAGAGGLSAALFGTLSGQETLLCEKTAQVGGTTSSSGGIIWAPLNEYAQAQGLGDTHAQALTYLKGEFGTHFDKDLTEAFLESAGTAISVLQHQAKVNFGLVPWPDYHPDRPGAAQTGRTLEAKRFDGRRLGRDFSMVRPPLPPLMLLGGMQVDKRKVDDFLNPFRTPATFFRVVKTFVRYGMDRLKYSRGTDLGAGNALVASMLYNLLRLGGAVWTNARILRLVTDESGVVGAIFQTDSGTKAVRARTGVILATGGFPNNRKMRAELSPGFPHDFTFGFEGNIGEGITVAREAGAVLDSNLASPGYWQPCSSLRHSDGSTTGVMYGYLDRGRPGVIAVDRHGKRFVNESNSYHDVGLALIKAGIADGNYFHFVCDREFVWRHGLGMIRPFNPNLGKFARMGYITVADSLQELAQKIHVDPVGLSETIGKHNNYAVTGIDLDFGKGSTAYNRLFGHKRAHPNPNLAPIHKPPFVALRIYPATLGTAVGLKATGDGQVVDANSKPIPGLYACGNDMASVMRGCYPAGGITLGPAIAFAYRAAMHAASVATARKDSTPRSEARPSPTVPPVAAAER